MWANNRTFHEDMEWISAADFIPWNRLQKCRIFVTGATGLIGSTLVEALLYANQKKELGMQVEALVRDENRARERFRDQLAQGTAQLRFITGSIEKLPEINGQVDYIIHGASQTSSKAFVERPVETIRTALRGTENVLELAHQKQAKGIVYLSSMEVYGHPRRGHKVVETDAGALSTLDIRSSYPLSKQQCENMCCAYASEYGVPAKIIRLTQTFGPGVKYDDERIFAYFGRCMDEKKDIVLRTKGETERSYLYTRDAVTAILAVLLKGKPGEAYNAADESTYCSIAEMAERVARLAGISVRYEPDEEKKNGYPQTLYMDLDAGKLRSLGWRPGGPVWKKCI